MIEHIFDEGDKVKLLFKPIQGGPYADEYVIMAVDGTGFYFIKNPEDKDDFLYVEDHEISLVEDKIV